MKKYNGNNILFKSFINNGLSKCGLKMTVIYDIDPVAAYYMYAGKYGASRFNLTKPVKRHFDLRKDA